MADGQFEFVRLADGQRLLGQTLMSVLPDWQAGKECLLFLSPHDDDVVIGGGLMIQAGLANKAVVHVAVVTDGSMGYCSLADKDRISDIRRGETLAACQTLGVEHGNVHWLGFPDCRLSLYQGRRPAAKGEAAQSHGFTGLQNAFTELLRRVRPTRIFMPTSADLHPDHRFVHSEMMISCFHAPGEIWPELGEPLPAPPAIHELAIYCKFPLPPSLRVTAAQAVFQRKLEAVGQFKSQRQIQSVVQTIRQAGPQEYVRAVEFVPYDPRTYHDAFE